MATDTIKATELFASLDETADELTQLISSIEEAAINIVPFKDSWTPAQLVVHVTKSNKAIAQGLNMNGTQAARNPEEGVPKLKTMFLDFDVKYQSPEFIVPEAKHYDKEEIITAFQNSVERLQHVRSNISLIEMINLPPFGEVTKLEILHFVLYHTKRHVHQLKNIIHILQSKN